MQRFVGEQEKFEGDPELNRKSVQLLESGGDVLPRFSASENPGSFKASMLCDFLTI